MKFQSLDDFFINKNCIGNYENRIFFFSYQAIIAKIQIVYIYYHLKKKRIELSVDNSNKSCKQNVDRIFYQIEKRYFCNENKAVYKYYLSPKRSLKYDLPLQNNLGESPNNKMLTCTGIIQQI